MSTKKKPKKRAPKLPEPVEAWAVNVRGVMLMFPDGAPILWSEEKYANRTQSGGRAFRVRVVPIRGGRGRG